MSKYEIGSLFQANKFHVISYSVDYEDKVDVIRYASHMRGSRFARHCKDQMSDWYEAFCKFSQILYEERYLAKYRMQPGDLILLDNTRMLHNGGRCHITGDDWRLVYGSFVSWMDVVLKTKSLMHRPISGTL